MAIDRLNKTFVDGEVWDATDINPVTAKIDECVDQINLNTDEIVTARGAEASLNDRINLAETSAWTAATNAETSATNAAASEQKAQEWADNDHGVEVETGKYSAKHWAIEAKDVLEGRLRTKDLISTGFIFNGLEASADATVLNQLNVTAGVALLRQADGSLVSFDIDATSFTASVVSTTYYLDLNSDGTYSFDTVHSTDPNYLAIAEVTTDASGNIATVADKRDLVLDLALEGLTIKGETIWHSGNDGEGSGLDADLLRGIAPIDFIISSYERKDLGGTSLSLAQDTDTDLFTFSSVTLNGNQWVLAIGQTALNNDLDHSGWMNLHVSTDGGSTWSVLTHHETGGSAGGTSVSPVIFYLYKPVAGTYLFKMSCGDRGAGTTYRIANGDISYTFGFLVVLGR